MRIQGNRGIMALCFLIIFLLEERKSFSQISPWHLLWEGHHAFHLLQNIKLEKLESSQAPELREVETEAQEMHASFSEGSQLTWTSTDRDAIFGPQSSFRSPDRYLFSLKRMAALSLFFFHGLLVTFRNFFRSTSIWQRSEEYLVGQRIFSSKHGDGKTG